MGPKPSPSSVSRVPRRVDPLQRDPLEDAAARGSPAAGEVEVGEAAEELEAERGRGHQPPDRTEGQHDHHGRAARAAAAADEGRVAGEEEERQQGGEQRRAALGPGDGCQGERRPQGVERAQRHPREEDREHGEQAGRDERRLAGQAGEVERPAIRSDAQEAAQHLRGDHAEQHGPGHADQPAPAQVARGRELERAEVGGGEEADAHQEDDRLRRIAAYRRPQRPVGPQREERKHEPALPRVARRRAHHDSRHAEEQPSSHQLGNAPGLCLAEAGEVLQHVDERPQGHGEGEREEAQESPPVAALAADTLLRQ